MNDERRTKHDERRTKNEERSPYPAACPELGVVVLTHNEAGNLPGFLAHLLPWVNEIVVVDDRSEDDTLEIARNAAPKVRVVEHPLDPDNGGFAAQRNRGIEEAGSDWLLHMDADERVPPELAQEICAAVRGDAAESHDAYRYRRRNFFLNRPMKGGGFQDWNNVQLARRGRHRFENAVHETVRIDADPPRIGQLQERMWHLNESTYEQRMTKSLVYCREVSRRLADREMRMTALHLLGLPLVEFLRKYVIKTGFRDGTPGLLWALHCTGAMFRACALLWDEQHRIPRESIEKNLGG